MDLSASEQDDNPFIEQLWLELPSDCCEECVVAKLFLTLVVVGKWVLFQSLRFRLLSDQTVGVKLGLGKGGRVSHTQSDLSIAQPLDCMG